MPLKAGKTNCQLFMACQIFGTAFSLIFEKEFYVEMNSNIGFNYRVNQILEAVDIDFNDVNITSDHPEHKVTQDYTNVSLKLSHIKDRSIDYLKEIVTNSSTADF